MNHKLQLEIPETLSDCVLRIQDSSVYLENVPPNCAQLQISVPGFKNSVYIDNITPGFSLNLTACNLKIQKDNCGSIYNSLPDGIYVIRYSVSPNDVVFVEYDHLRETKALTKLKKLYCELDLLNCEPNSQIKKMRKDAEQVWQYLQGAKSSVEYCRQATKGLEMYKQAMKILDKVNCKNCH